MNEYFHFTVRQKSEMHAMALHGETCVNTTLSQEEDKEDREHSELLLSSRQCKIALSSSGEEGEPEAPSCTTRSRKKARHATALSSSAFRGVSRHRYDSRLTKLS